jgi:DNA topoisomerase IA
MIVDRDREIKDFVFWRILRIDAKFEQFVASSFQYDNKSVDIKSLIKQIHDSIVINPMTLNP